MFLPNKYDDFAADDSGSVLREQKKKTATCETSGGSRRNSNGIYLSK